ncbi:MAG: hypothetical protein BWY11_01885 [Firmicutes bacterium ADurb.Bin182]|nr:MAG: hypothetical protein BWY11_01885 [Firmicutes bacterium ADurb.Bin182]
MKPNTQAGRKKTLKIIGSAIGVLIVLFLLSFIPVLSLKTGGMQTLRGNYITVYYETEYAAARDVFELADAQSERIANALGFDAPQDIRMYIYDRQSTFQTKKYGLAALLLDLDWYIGDNKGTNVLLTSPANPGKVHGYDAVVQASVHEMVHAYNSILNKRMPLWINEGLALYLSNGDPREDLYTTSYVPGLEQTHTSDPVEFSNMGGYDFAHTYIEYLDKTFGWDSVLYLAETNDYEKAFGMSEDDVYTGWIEFLKENYS